MRTQKHSTRMNFLFPRALGVLMTFAATSPAFGAAVLTSYITVQKTVVPQGGTFKVWMVVSNAGDVLLPGIFPDGFILQTQGDGWVARKQWVTPSTVSLPPGRAATFTFTYRGYLPGTVAFSGSARCPQTSSPDSDSEPVLITGRRVTNKATTDALGRATVKIGRNSVPLKFIDEDTGKPQVGLSVALALDRRDKSRAVLAVGDSFSRYPVQFIVLRGEQSSPAASSSAKAASPPKLAPAQLRIPIMAGGCSGNGVSAQILKTMTTPHLPPPPQPPSSVFQSIREAANLLLSQKISEVEENIRCPDAKQSQEDFLEQLDNALVSYFTERVVNFECQVFSGGSSNFCEGVEYIRGRADDMLNYWKLAKNILFPCDDNPTSQLKIISPRNPPPSLDQIIYVAPTSPEQVLPPLCPISVSATDASGQPIANGTAELTCHSELGSGYLANVLAGNALGHIRKGDYDWTIHAEGYQAQCGTTLVTEQGATIRAVLQPNPIVSGKVAANRSTSFLPTGTQFTLTPQFLDKNGNAVSCGAPMFIADNPPGTTVATVDRNTGVVTVHSGCGAARISAWCNGISTDGVFVSSDCNGTLPPRAPSTISVSPTALNFVATECGDDAASQSFAVVNTSGHSLRYSISWSPSSWLHVLDDNNTSEFPVAVDASGLRAGSYSGSITVTDNDEPTNRKTIPVRLTVKAPSAVVAVSGRWSGTWVQDIGGFCDATYSLAWSLNQSDSRVSGNYTTVVQDSCVDPTGTTQSAALVNGQLCGNTITIYTAGGRPFVGTVNGPTISGSSGGAFPGSFTLTRQ
jgi:hypothetical protein